MPDIFSLFESFNYFILALAQTEQWRKIMGKNQKSDALRRLARQAKERLSSGGYNQPERYGSIFKVYEGGIVADYKLVVLSDTEDEKLYNRVCEILNQNVDITNPIGQIVDKTKLANMNNYERDRYIMNLKDKYLEMRERYLKENLKAL